MAKPASRNSGRSGGKSRKGSSIFTGVLIGLIFGALLAGGVALWITGSNPFTPVRDAVEPAKAGSHAGSGTPKPAPAAAPDTAPSFDFYKVLPDNSGGGSLPSAAPAPSTPVFYLQAGAFQKADQADNLKAQLALLGVEASIQTSEVADKGVVHRVRIGPFRSMADVDRTRSLLAQNKIAVTLVREVPTQQETP
ncbi:SPOR domain-containing protein [Thiobacillus sedimenti]|uniref:SPOR domain-containing protein n=1 Tax=Thiobacillus sedimenti TaxID=3110231 RepID=A0ABZ1CIY8_9PROT|nr:SPOR domain-containing protein [Thiobacillus sp. SCUT-2]WRS39217.1 SPOR domain-containing protein [Thiobacillus sp. SCUT-2]